MADAPSPVPQVFRFHYIKSNAYRVVHADGVIGGPTPNGSINASFFSERLPIPTVIDQVIKDVGGGRGVLGDEVHREGKTGVIREVEVGLAMTLDMAKRLYGWLGAHIEQLEKVEAAIKVGDNTGVPDAS